MTGEAGTSATGLDVAGNNQRERYCDAFQRCPAGLLVTTPDGQIIDANAIISEKLGCPRERLLTMNVNSLLAEHDRLRHSTAVRSLLDGDSVSVILNAEIAGKDDRQIFISACAVKLSGSGRGLPELLYQIEDISVMREHLRELTRLAEHDHLTGLLNRRSFEDRLAVAQNMAEVDGIDSPLLIFDLDAFKAVNDNYGHPIGDRLLQEVAKTLRDQFRASDAIARIGGDEFAIVMFGCPARQAVVAGRKVLAALAAIDFTEAEAPIRASVGIAMVTGVSTLAVEPFVAADDALYRAKSRGGNCLEADFPMPAATQPIETLPVNAG